MSEETETPPRQPAKSAETSTSTPGETGLYVMPGLVPRVVYAFRRKKGVIPTPRTLSKNLEITLDYANASLFHFLFEELEDLRRMVGRKPMAVARSAEAGERKVA